jgi:hypothetical protein
VKEKGLCKEVVVVYLRDNLAFFLGDWRELQKRKANWNSVYPRPDSEKVSTEYEARKALPLSQPVRSVVLIFRLLGRTRKDRISCSER